ncbi:hypothetical protein GXW74_12860 [Roseomonas eburnea]|uniref:Uncharacterized protein n=1 Tax=Neoroseomonas eburnea TaxID=1346889 RepID=A0A9X9XCE3_9PROT|nr:hypothetical protein [Neoroseomonas eburnea]MBR0681379.1 hypothetical protein [Neoroseomonas eburnea]
MTRLRRRLMIAAGLAMPFARPTLAQGTPAMRGRAPSRFAPHVREEIDLREPAVRALGIRAE